MIQKKRSIFCEIIIKDIVKGKKSYEHVSSSKWLYLANIQGDSEEKVNIL